MVKFQFSHPSFVTFSILLITFILLEIILGGINYDAANCSQGDIIIPGVWMIFNGLAFLILLIVFIFIYFCSNDENSRIRLTIRTLVIFTFFEFIWLIIGSISLWRDNPQCDTNEFENIITAFLICHFIMLPFFFLFIFFYSKTQKQ